LNLLSKWVAGSLGMTLCVIVCAAWLDRPIAYFMHAVFGRVEFLGRFTGTPSFFSPLAILVLLAFLARRITFRPFRKPDVVLILCECSLLLAKLVRDPLKFVFGRTWPLYHTPSLIHDGVYGFNFFHAGREFESFPSGHTASVCALVVVLWLCYPQFRLIYAGAIAAMAFPLVVANYHFVSDVIAGAFIGSSTALLAVSVWEAWNRRGASVRLGGMILGRKTGQPP
jgi:membrane-associated phospholipid phosphatase